MKNNRQFICVDQIQKVEENSERTHFANSTWHFDNPRTTLRNYASLFEAKI